MECKNFLFKGKIISFINNFFMSKKYWLICLILILISFFSLMKFNNYEHPKMEFIVLIFSCILCVFLISFYHGHRDDKNFYKTAFIVIFIFGIVFSFLTPILCTHDEVEHFVRAEITSNGVINPEYNETPVKINGIQVKGYFFTIQSTFDLTKEGVATVAYTEMDMVNSSIFNTEADTQPINTTPARFHSAFAQNPFFGYIAPAMGMVIAKLLDLNAIWLLWLGRIFNALLYAILVSYAIKKTPILKMPLFVVACIPAALSQAASVSIDPMINGLAILSIAYFLLFYKSPKNSIDHKDLIKFSIIILLMGLCKITYFSFIFLLLFLPSNIFKKKKYYYYTGFIILIFIVIALIWSNLAIPLTDNSWRHVFYESHNVDSFNQIKYILTHKKDTIINLLHVFGNLDRDLKCESLVYHTAFLIFTGAVYLLYPHEKIRFKAKMGALIVFLMIYFGTYITFLISWNPVGDLIPHGVQPRYFFPALALIPIFLGFNHMEGDKSEIDYYLVVLTLVFICLRIFAVTTLVY